MEKTGHFYFGLTAPAGLISYHPGRDWTADSDEDIVVNVTVHIYIARAVELGLVPIFLPLGSRFDAYGASEECYAPNSLTPNLNSYGYSRT